MWAGVGVSQIIDIRGFPFLSYDAFKAAVTKGDAQLGIEYAAARGLVRVTKSPAAALVVLGLSWVTPLLALVSLVLPFSTGNWWTLGGVASSFIGQTLANPYNPVKGLIGLAVVGAMRHVVFARAILQALLGQLVVNPHDPVGSSIKLAIKLAVLGAILHVAFAGTLLQGPAWISFCFAVSAMVLWALNHLAWRWAHAAALRSEAIAAVLFKTHNLHIRDRQGNVHDAEPSGAA